MKSRRDPPFQRQGMQPPVNSPAASAPPAAEALLQQARAHHAAGRLPQAEALYREVLASVPGHPDALHLLGVLAFQVGQPAVALEILDLALQARPDFPEAHFSRGNALYALQRYPEAVAGYDRALQLKPLYAEAHSNRGSALIALQQPQAAVESFNRAIQLKPDYADAYANRASALCALQQYQQAVESYNEVLILRPGAAEIHVNRGNALYVLGQYQAALESFDHALRLQPDYAEAHFNRANCLYSLRQFPEAVASYDQAVRIRPNYAEAYNNRGGALHAMEQFQAALESYDRAIEFKPDYADAYSNRGNALCVLQQYQQSLDSCDQAIQFNQLLADAHYNRANTLYALQQYQAALDSYDIAVRLQPGNARAHNNRSNALHALQHYQEALESCTRAIQLDPGYADAYCNLGNAFQSLKRYLEAIESYERAIALKPENADGHYNRANVLLPLKRYQEAFESYSSALHFKPDYIYLLGIRLHMRSFLCDWDGIEDDCRQLEAAIARGEKATVPFPVLSISTSPALQRQAAEIYARDKFPEQPAVAFPRRPRRDRIRIGYFSADYHNHATSYLMAELFERHDRSRFEIFAFSFGLNPADEMNRRVSSAMDRFLDVSAMPDREVAQLARDLEIDIAVDLKGFTQEARTGIFAEHAAPIQVSYLGFPGTMGAAYIHYLIADHTLIPESLRQHYSEKIVRLPDSYQVNDTQRPISAIPATRAAEGLPESAFVFCCFNNIYKITPSVFDSWMRILAQVEGSVLWLLEDNPWATANLRNEAARRGVAPERIIFARPRPLADHLARHRLANLFLDTLPYNAHTTASDALWVGLPLLTRAGETFASRVAASLLRAVNLPQLITATPAEFEAQAVALAHHPERLLALRRQLEQNRLTVPLFDIRAFTRHLEAAYTAIYDRYHAGLPPDHIDIPRQPLSP